jgi:chromosome segregation ATPase
MLSAVYTLCRERADDLAGLKGVYEAAKGEVNAIKQERDMLMKRCDEATREAKEKGKEAEGAREREMEGRRVAADREAEAKEARGMLEGERGREARAVERMKRAENHAAELQKEVVKLRSQLDDAVEELTRVKEGEGGYRSRASALSEELKAAKASAEMANDALKEKEIMVESLQVGKALHAAHTPPKNPQNYRL